MLAEVLLVLASLGFYALSRSYYYIFSMAVFGLFSSTVMYLLQILKQRRYRRKRAAFDRRYAMADACGYLAGSLLVLAGWRPIQDVKVLLALGLLQTLLVYLLYLRCYRAQRTAGGRRSRAPLAA
jgi:phosphatidylglycerophosphate synthase